MKHQSYKPKNELKKYIKEFLITEAPEFVGKRWYPLPTGYPEVIITYSKPTLNSVTGRSGVSSTHGFIGFDTKINPVTFIVEEELKFISAIIKPHVVFDLFGFKLEDVMYNRIILEQFIGKKLFDIIDEIKYASSDLGKIIPVESWMHKCQRQNSPQINDVIKEVVHEIVMNNTTNIESISKKHHISLRTIHRQFQTKLGITAKDYVRIIRFNNAFKLLHNTPNIDIMQVIIDCNYYDKPHFAKDFKFFTGKTVEQVFKEENTYIFTNRIYLRVDS